ncbi:MAG: nucleoside hydrolase [Fusicatenibacter sp.]|nr:nucleoside hydrolase [Fusicatenibacter sp.]
MNARKVIIDCDPGIDDALALMLALSSPELEILGITIVCGNVPTSQGAKNALKILEWMGQTNIPVYSGEETPLVRDYVDASDTHGMDGLGESGYADVLSSAPRADAVSFLINTLKTTPNVSIIAIGPLTNIARVILRDPDCLANLQEFVSMGGSYKSHGNCSPVAEYNYWCDPDGAKIVFDAFASLPHLKGKLLQMVGLDVTRKIVLTPNLLEYMKNVNPLMGTRIERITRFYFDFHWKQEGVIGCVINDPLAVACFLDPNLCSGFDSYTQIETTGLGIGQSIVDAMNFYQKAPNSHILTQVNVSGFLQLFLTRVIGAKKEQIESILPQILSPAPRFPHETCYASLEDIRRREFS